LYINLIDKHVDKCCIHEVSDLEVKCSPTLGDMLITYGSCQFSTLGFVVERFLAIDRFKSEPYWKLRMIDNRDELSVEFRWTRVRLFKKSLVRSFWIYGMAGNYSGKSDINQKTNGNFYPSISL